jgi:5'-3' exonuclease
MTKDIEKVQKMETNENESKTTIEELVKKFGDELGEQLYKLNNLGTEFSMQYIIFDGHITQNAFCGKIKCHNKYAWPSVSLPCEVSLLSYSKIKKEIQQLSDNKSALIRISDNKVQLKINKKTFALYKF